MSELDVLLRESLGRLAEPGDPTGVAEAIRARVEAAGPPGDGGSGGGLGGGGTAGTGGLGGAFWSGPAPLAILIGLSLAGGAALGVTRDDAPSSPTPAHVNAASPHGVPAAACPAGAAVTTLDPGARVLALARSEDGEYLAVRDPRSLDTVVWIAAPALIVDEGEDADALPVAGCDVAVALASPIPTPSPAPGETTEPTEPTEPAPQPDPTKPTNDPAPPPPPPPPPGDTQAPTIQVGSWSEPYICTTDSPWGAQSATITITVGDNVGVTSASASSPTAGVSLTGPTGSGASRTFTLTRSGATDANVTVSFVVGDAAGNTVAASSPSLATYGPGNCLG